MPDTLCTPAKSNSAPCHTRPLAGGDFRPLPGPNPAAPSHARREYQQPTPQVREQATNKQSTSIPATDPSSFPLPPHPTSLPGGRAAAPGTPWVRASPRVQFDEQAVNKLPTSDPAINILQRFLPATDSRLPADDSPASSSLHAPTDEQQGSPHAREQDGNRPRTGVPATNASAVHMTSDTVSPASPESRARKSPAGRLTPPRAPSVPTARLVPFDDRLSHSPGCIGAPRAIQCSPSPPAPLSILGEGSLVPGFVGSPSPSLWASGVWYTGLCRLPLAQSLGEGAGG
jgi:hypothetical protein